MSEQTALITGAAQGFGRAVAAELVARRWRVLGLVRQASDVTALGQAGTPGLTWMYGDVTSRELPEVLKRELPKAVTHLDLLVNNAGVSGRTSKIADVGIDEMMHLMDVHCYGPVRCIQGCLDLLRRAPRPTIVNVSSRLGSVERVATGGFDELNVSYAMRISKAAQNMLSAALIRELGPLGVRVLAVHPGQVTTRMASRDADMSPEDAARRFVDWLLADGSPSAGFFEPEQGSISW